MYIVLPRSKFCQTPQKNRRTVTDRIYELKKILKKTSKKHEILVLNDILARYSS